MNIVVLFVFFFKERKKTPKHRKPQNLPHPLTSIFPPPQIKQQQKQQQKEITHTHTHTKKEKKTQNPTNQTKKDAAMC